MSSMQVNKDGGKKNKRIKGRGSDAYLASAANVLLSLMPRQLSRSSFERYFSEVTSVFKAAALVTADVYEERSRRRGVWDRRHVLIPRTAPALSVTSLFSWHQSKPRASTGRCWPLIKSMGSRHGGWWSNYKFATQIWPQGSSECT